MADSKDLIGKIMQLLHAIAIDRKAGVPPFRCHKGHWPGPPSCTGTISVHKEKFGLALHDGKDDGQAVYVSEKMAKFLNRYVLYPDSVTPTWTRQDLEKDLKDLVLSRASGESFFQCHKGHWPGPPSCLGPVTIHKDNYGIALYHGTHDWEAVYVSEKMANLLAELRVLYDRFVDLKNQEFKAFASRASEKASEGMFVRLPRSPMGVE